MIGVMPKFSIKDLMISTAIVGAGLLIAKAAINGGRSLDELGGNDNSLNYFAYGCGIVGCGFVGIGIFRPLSKPGLGFVLGVAVGFLIVRGL